LSENDEITEERLAVIKNTAVFEDAKNYAANLVSRRSYTEKTMREKLIAHIGDEEITDKTISFLKEYKLIDDYDYATRYSHDLVHLKKLGMSSVRWKLKEKGISPHIVEKVLTELDFSDEIKDNLENLAQKKLGGNYDIKNIAKVKRYLATRGYSFDDINSVFSKIKAEDDGYEG
ncbi:MAG: regulatory protein RecX, partial [Clostridia bacterium]|nr:regulatory protein RecX [Clostridia bacterium]